VGVPQVALYRGNGTKITYEVMKRVLDIDFITLPNLIAGREIIPEMLMHYCSPSLVAEKIGPLLRDTSERRAQLDGYAEIRRILGTADAADNTAGAILNDLRR